MDATPLRDSNVFLLLSFKFPPCYRRDTPVSELVLHLGDHDLTQLNETSHVRRGVRRVLFHSHFHPFVLSNDIALLQLDRPVPLTGTIQPVCLPQKGKIRDAFIVGFTNWVLR
jgi:Trypsin.